MMAAVAQNCGEPLTVWVPLKYHEKKWLSGGTAETHPLCLNVQEKKKRKENTAQINTFILKKENHESILKTLR